MFNRISRIAFSVLFLSMLTIPLVTTNLQKDRISEDENRKLAPMAELYDADGSLNRHFTADFETWINDNIGQRARMVLDNARMEYNLFNVLPRSKDMYLGPNGELNYATEPMLKDYQHANLYSFQYLRKTAYSLRALRDYARSHDAAFYYFQCWDKHSIYPEYFPTSVVQTGSESKTDGIVKAYNKYTDVNVISPKQALLDEKNVHPTFSVWGDATHWNPRGAYVGYLALMEAINKDSEIQYKVLQESDYDITTPDQGSTLFGNIHEVDHIETFNIRNPHSTMTNEKLTAHAEDPRHRFFTNDDVNNDTRLLIIGDSYFNSFIIDDLAESFHEVIMIWGAYMEDYQGIMDSYCPDIVVVECAERVDLTKLINNAAAKIQSET